MDAVILGFGPQARARAAALAALTAGATSVRVVPASPASRIPRKLGIRGVEVEEGAGTPALRAALQACEPGPALLIHDDVALPAASLDAMLKALKEGGCRYVVPHTNDRETDHFWTSLPPASRPDAVKEAVAVAPTEGGRVLRVRPSCLLADRDDLLALAERHLVDPRQYLEDVSLGFVVAAGAVAAHDGTCGDRLLPPIGPDGRPLLVAALIVKDEEELLPGCLASLAGVVDRVEVCDTGSTDRTRELAREAGAVVSQIEWRDDFAWARNQVLERSADAWWVLVLDADERVRCEDPERLRRHLATFRHEYPAFKLTVRNLHLDGGVTSELESVRIFPAREVCYEGAVHEMPRRRDGGPLVAASLSLLGLDHLGYDPEVVDRRGKGHRNLELARAAHQDTPSAKTAVDLARSLTLAGAQPAEAVPYLEEALKTDGLEPAARAYLLGMLAHSRTRMGDDRSAETAAREALELVPADPLAGATLALILESRADPEAVVALADELAGRPSPRPMFDVEQNELVFWSVVAAAKVRVGRVEEGLDHVLAVLEERPDGFQRWKALVEALAEHTPTRLVELLLPLTLRDRSGDWLAVVRELLAPEQAAVLSVAHLEAGGTDPEVARTALATALVAGRPDLLEVAGRHAEEAAPDAWRWAQEEAQRRWPDRAPSRERATIDR